MQSYISEEVHTQLPTCILMHVWYQMSYNYQQCQHYQHYQQIKLINEQKSYLFSLLSTLSTSTIKY